MIINVPFSGFYDSIHSGIIEDAVNSEVSELKESDQETIVNDFSYCEKSLLEGYVGLYLEAVVKDLNQEHNLEISLTFENLSSPREYNFDTDRIFAELPSDDILSLFSVVDKEDLKDLIKSRFTSYDGFISFYSNSLQGWDIDPLNWDYNQLSLLIELLLSTDFELYSMDDKNCTGELNEVIQKGFSKDALEVLNATV